MSGVPARIAGIAIPDSALAIHARVRVSDGYLTLLSDGERLTGAHALGPEAGATSGSSRVQRTPTLPAARRRIPNR